MHHVIRLFLCQKTVALRTVEIPSRIIILFNVVLCRWRDHDELLYPLWPHRGIETGQVATIGVASQDELLWDHTLLSEAIYCVDHEVSQPLLRMLLIRCIL